MIDLKAVTAKRNRLKPQKVEDHIVLKMNSALVRQYKKTYGVEIPVESQSNLDEEEEDYEQEVVSDQEENVADNDDDEEEEFNFDGL